MNDHFAHCANELKKHHYERYIATLYLAPPIRGAAQVLFAFNQEIHRISHLTSQAMPGEIRLQWWRDSISNRSSSALNPIAKALVEVIENYELPKQNFDELLEARIFDLYNDTIDSRHQLETYLGQTRSIIFQMLATITANENGQKLGAEVATASGHAGIAIGMAELLGELPHHFHVQRVYFPTDLSDYKMINQTGKLSKISEPWLSDVIKYSRVHLNLANQAIGNLPSNIAMLYLPLINAKLMLETTEKSGVDLGAKPMTPSRLKCHFALWRAARNISVDSKAINDKH